MREYGNKVDENQEEVNQSMYKRNVDEARKYNRKRKIILKHESKVVN